MKSISIPRLKRSLDSSSSFSLPLEMKSISIPRLKLQCLIPSGMYSPCNLKWKASRFRDWNSSTIRHPCGSLWSGLKWKASRFRDWNSFGNDAPSPLIMSLKWKASRFRDWNSKLCKGVSTPKSENLKWKASRFRDWNNPSLKTADSLTKRTWNEKHLDSEIETRSTIWY